MCLILCLSVKSYRRPHTGLRGVQLPSGKARLVLSRGYFRLFSCSALTEAPGLGVFLCCSFFLFRVFSHGFSGVLRLSGWTNTECSVGGRRTERFSGHSVCDFNQILIIKVILCAFF